MASESEPIRARGIIVNYTMLSKYVTVRVTFVPAQNKNVITLPVSFTGSYAEDEPNFSRQINLILQKKVSGVDKVVNFKYFSRT